MKTKAKLQNLYTSDASKKLYNNRFSIPFGDIDSIGISDFSYLVTVLYKKK